LHEYSQACERQTGVKGEYGAWTCWAIRRAVWVSRGHKVGTARDVDAMFAAAAREIRAAMRDGRLPARAVPVTFVPPEWELLVRAMPRSLVATWRMLGSTMPGDPRSERIGAREVELFEAVAMRRTANSARTDGQDVSSDTWHSSRGARRFDRLKRDLAGAQPWLVWFQATVIPLGLVVGLTGVRRGRLGARWGVLMIVLLSALAARFLLVVLCDAAGIDAQRRYLLPASVVATVAALFAAQAVIAVFAAWMRGRRRAPRMASAPAGVREKSLDVPTR
jgi:hypothetical protein